MHAGILISVPSSHKFTQAHAIQEQFVAPKTLGQRHKNAAELADWLQSTNTVRYQEQVVL